MTERAPLDSLEAAAEILARGIGRVLRTRALRAGSDHKETGTTSASAHSQLAKPLESSSEESVHVTRANLDGLAR
jgi:hypothetical protein